MEKEVSISQTYVHTVIKYSVGFILWGLFFTSGHILSSPVAGSLATLPFCVLRRLYDQTPLSTDDGVLLRRMTLDIGCLHLILACLSVLSHHAPRINNGTGSSTPSEVNIANS